ncbi:hypothetical protein MKJ01_09425 [Chryseobacterium sp. SSA4.19]|uniref:hypothetical protein n=1 Tax=Chryseobacterium sp. SSA4.19 TaxID=2919915 RepID=UPI001F4D5A19|nr:hypothetical protein [Chryseobacterium sp. SSA4.19]MCJ8153976.1 hypothetical protein [Chryseobacterium sp. SSA4.19]
MKSIILLTLFPLLMYCQVNSFDLDRLSFPVDLSAIEKKYELHKNSDLSGIIIYNSTDPSLLQFSGFSFSGTLNKQEQSILSTNYVSFYKNRTKNQVNAYRLEIRTILKTEEFEKLLEKKLGKTDFYYRNSEFSYRIWSVGNKLYLFETNNTGRYNNEKFKSCNLYVLAKEDQLLSNYFISGGFQYYGDYLQEKNRLEHKGKKYTYRNFVDDREKQDGTDSFYLKDYVK